MQFQIFTDKAGEYRWRLRAGNNEIIAQSEGYKNKADCQHAIDLVKSTDAGTPVNEVEA